VGWSHPHPTPEKTVKRRLQDCDATLASDDGPIFSTVAKLVDALKRSIPEGTQNAERKKEALRLGRELLRGTQVRGEVRLAISLEILPDSDQYVELSTLSLRLWEYRRWKDDTPCRRTFGLTTFLTKSRKTAKSFSITAAYAVDAISWNRPTARAGRPLIWVFCESSLLRTA